MAEKRPQKKSKIDVFTEMIGQPKKDANFFFGDSYTSTLRLIFKTDQTSKNEKKMV